MTRAPERRRRHVVFLGRMKSRQCDGRSPLRVRCVFGNPGTTELPFLDAAPGLGLEYVLGLQEATAVARPTATPRPPGGSAVVNVTWRRPRPTAFDPPQRRAGEDAACRHRGPTRYPFPDGRADPPPISSGCGALHEVVLRAAARGRGTRGTPPRAQGRVTPPTGPVFLALRMDLLRGVVETRAGAARDRDTLTPRAGRGRARRPSSWHEPARRS